MADAKRDENRIPTALGVSSVDSTTPVAFQVNPVTGRLLVDVGGGYTNLTQFVDQTAWRVFYSNGSGDVTELALGGAGTYLQSNGAALAPTWVTPAGTGDVSKVGTPANNQIGVWTGDGTIEGDTGLTFDTATDLLTTGIVNSTSLTASEIVLTDASKNLVSAAVATYPSLTELSYVKGVTSAIQTQLNAKGTGNVTKVGTPADNQVGVWTGDGTLEGDAGFTFDGGLGITVADAENKVGLTINQNDKTNYVPAIELNTSGDQYHPAVLNYYNSYAGTVGQDGDIGTMSFYGKDSAGNKTTFAFFYAGINDNTDTQEDGQFQISVTKAGTSRTLLDMYGNGVNGIYVGSSAVGPGVVSSAGSQDLTLQTGNATTGNITIVDGAAGAIQINPNGAGLFDVNATMDISGNIELGHATDTTIARVSAGVISVEGVTVPTISSTNTLTNKRITRRVTTTNAPGATPTTNTDNVDVMNFTGLNTAITSMTTNLSGTPVDGDLIMFRFTDDGTARAITWGASFAATTVALPTTTVISTMLRVGFQYSGSTWKCIATA